MNLQETKPWRNLILLALALFAIYQFGLGILSNLSGFLMLILLAWLISIAMEPPVAWFERRGYRRGLGAGAVLLGLVVFVIGFLTTFGGMLFSQLAAAVESAPTVVTTITGWLNSTFDLALNAEQIITRLNLDSSSLTPLATNLAGGFFGIVSSILTFIFDFLTILVFAFYLSAEAPKVKRGIASWLKPESQKVFVTIWDIAVNKTGGFVVSRLVLATVSAAAHVLFFWAIGVPYWLPLGLFAGITSQFVPTIGTYLGIAVPAIFSLGNDALDVIWIVAFATVYQQIENYILSPRVSRATMDLHPAVALASVFIGHAMFGPIGAVIGIPIVAGVIAVIDTYGKRHQLIESLHLEQESD